MWTLNNRLGGPSLVGLLVAAVVTTAAGQVTSITQPATLPAEVKEIGQLKPQTICPIMGGKIDKKVFVDVAGYRGGFAGYLISLTGRFKFEILQIVGKSWIAK